MIMTTKMTVYPQYINNKREDPIKWSVCVKQQEIKGNCNGDNGIIIKRTKYLFELFDQHHVNRYIKIKQNEKDPSDE